MSFPKLIDIIKPVIAEEIRREKGRERKIKQIVREERNVRLPSVIYSKRGEGRVDEVSIISSHDRFRIKVDVDGTSIINKTYSELTEISPYVKWISAAYDGNKYSLSINNIYFSDNILIEVVPTNSNANTIDYVIIKVEELI